MKNQLRYFRFFNGKTQQQLSKESGISQAKISNIERGVTDPQKEDKKALSMVLGVSAEALFERE